MKNLILIMVMVFVASCSSTGEWFKKVFEPKSEMDEVHEFHRPLELQRLIPRQGYEGKLTNRVCVSFYGDKCEKESVREYDLNEPDIRNRLITLQFACSVNGKRYRICPDKAGLCRREKETVCSKWGRRLISRKKYCKKWTDNITEKFISTNDYQFLLDARTECKKGL